MKDPDVRQVYTAIGGGATGSDPFAVGGAPESRKATLLLNLSPREGRDQQQAADRRPPARGAGDRARDPQHGRLRRRRREAGGGADRRRRPQRWPRPVARVVSASCAALAGLGNVTSSAALTRPELVVRPGSGARRRPRRDRGGDRRHAARRHRRRLRAEPRQAEPVAAPGADRGAAAGGGARRPRRCSSGWRCPAASGNVPLANVADPGDRFGPGADRPLRPQPQRAAGDRAQRPGARRRARQGRPAAEPGQPAADGAPRRTRRRRRA